MSMDPWNNKPLTQAGATNNAIDPAWAQYWRDHPELGGPFGADGQPTNPPAPAPAPVRQTDSGGGGPAAPAKYSNAVYDKTSGTWSVYDGKTWKTGTTTADLITNLDDALKKAHPDWYWGQYANDANKAYQAEIHGGDAAAYDKASGTWNYYNGEAKRWTYGLDTTGLQGAMSDYLKAQHPDWYWADYQGKADKSYQDEIHGGDKATYNKQTHTWDYHNGQYGWNTSGWSTADLKNVTSKYLQDQHPDWYWGDVAKQGDKDNMNEIDQGAARAQREAAMGSSVTKSGSAGI